MCQDSNSQPPNQVFPTLTTRPEAKFVILKHSITTKTLALK